MPIQVVSRESLQKCLQQDTSEDEADPPSRQAAAALQGLSLAIPVIALTAEDAARYASANCDNAGAAGDQDRKVLIIGNHL
eukprot:s7989_g1.t1